MLVSIQRLLDFDGCSNPQFSRADGLGRVGVAGFLTGMVFGVHLSIAGCCLAINGLVLSRLVRQESRGTGKHRVRVRPEQGSGQVGHTLLAKGNPFRLGMRGVCANFHTAAAIIAEVCMQSLVHMYDRSERLYLHT